VWECPHARPTKPALTPGRDARGGTCSPARRGRSAPKLERWCVYVCSKQSGVKKPPPELLGVFDFLALVARPAGMAVASHGLVPVGTGHLFLVSRVDRGRV
jgi:hypothetical protein